MKKILLTYTLLFSILLHAQKQTFDMVSYTPPKGWKKTVAEGGIQLTRSNETTGAYCSVSIYKSVPGTEDAQKNFDLAWEALPKQLVTVESDPLIQSPTMQDGWTVISGYAPFELQGSKGVVTLLTATAGEKMANLLIITNTDVYAKQVSAFLKSVTLKKMTVKKPATPGTTTPAAPVTTTTSANGSNAEIIGTWSKTGSINPEYADPVATTLAGYTTDQYTFNSNGTYIFYSKSFRMTLDKIIFIRESGTYDINGKSITLKPQKSVLEAWTKKNNSDGYGKLASSQPMNLEQVTYQFSKYYFSGIQEWNLVLQADKPTRRDGPFSNNKSLPNAWYFKTPGPNTEKLTAPVSN